MVVEKLHRQRRISCICFSLLGLLLYDEAGDNRAGSDALVFRLHSVNGSNVLVINRYNRLLRGIRVYSKNIRRCKNRLVINYH